MKQLESEGIGRYEEIVPFFEKNGRPQSFYSPSGTFIIQSMPPESNLILLYTNDFIVESQTPDVAFWVVDASDSSSWGSSAERLSAALSGGMLNPLEKLIIVVSKM